LTKPFLDCEGFGKALHREAKERKVLKKIRAEGTEADEQARNNIPTSKNEQDIENVFARLTACELRTSVSKTNYKMV
jgi:hypothetical protein